MSDSNSSRERSFGLQIFLVLHTNTQRLFSLVIIFLSFFLSIRTTNIENATQYRVRENGNPKRKLSERLWSKRFQISGFWVLLRRLKSISLGNLLYQGNSILFLSESLEDFQSLQCFLFRLMAYLKREIWVKFEKVRK